jgi:hypothetical protein
MEFGQFRFAVQMPLHVGDVWVIAVVALQLVQHLQEHAQDRFTTGSGIGLGIDVEQNHIGVGRHGPFHVAEHHGVFDLLLEELDRMAAFALERVESVFQQVRQDFQEVRFAAAEPTRDPDADFAGDGGVFLVVDHVQEGCQEFAQVLVQFLGDDEFIQFLPDG